MDKSSIFRLCFQTLWAWPFISAKSCSLKSVERLYVPWMWNWKTKYLSVRMGLKEMEVEIYAAWMTGIKFENQVHLQPLSLGGHAKFHEQGHRWYIIYTMLVRPTNPSLMWSLTEMLFKPEDLKTLPFCFLVEGKQLENGAFCKQWCHDNYVISLHWSSFLQTQIQNDWLLFHFQISFA